MRCSVLLADGELGPALSRAKSMVEAGRCTVDRLTVYPGRPWQLTLRFPTTTSAREIDRALRTLGGRRIGDRFAGMARQEPFHWQADGAGDPRGE